MAIYPNGFTTKEISSPGAHGEIFQTSLPGYRDGADRINRTNNTLNSSAHDAPNIKYELDPRLPALFKYGFAYGYNQIVIPKGRVVAADPYMDLLSSEMMNGYRANKDGTGFDTKKSFNTLTLANGGAPVKLRADGDVYPNQDYVSADAKEQAVSQIGKEWSPLIGYTDAYDKTTYRPFAKSGPAAQITAASYTVGAVTGKLEKNGVVDNSVRPGNIPVGIMYRNEYTRDDDAFNGITPGAVITDALVELPWFYFKDKAEANPWGSAYGDLFPGALVKPDENGRIVVSPLSYESYFGDDGMKLAEYELERQQVIGQVYSVNRDLLPEGAARWATWALSDRRNFQSFNPDIYRATNRDGEDNTMATAYNSTGEYPGYPYDANVNMNDMHMMGGNRPYDTRMNDEYEYDNLGIPGLTDGKNVVNRDFAWQTVGHLSIDENATAYEPIFLRTSEIDINSLQIQIDYGATTACAKDALVPAKATSAGVADTFIKVDYVNELQGIVVVSVTDKTKADTYLKSKEDNTLAIKLKFKKRGLSGVPTFMDWDGCMGSIKVLLTK